MLSADRWQVSVIRLAEARETTMIAATAGVLIVLIKLAVIVQLHPRRAVRSMGTIQLAGWFLAAAVIASPQCIPASAESVPGLIVGRAKGEGSRTGIVPTGRRVGN